jgi:hypothetical protein
MRNPSSPLNWPGTVISAKAGGTTRLSFLFAGTHAGDLGATVDSCGAFLSTPSIPLSKIQANVGMSPLRDKYVHIECKIKREE